MSKSSDQELIEQSLSGDAEAFSVLVRRYQKRIYRLAVHMLHDDTEAEDVTQETFVRAYQGLNRFQGNSQPYTWLYRIAVNLSLNIIRARKPRQHTTEASDPRIENWVAARATIVGSDPSAASEQRQLAAALCEAIDDLSDSLRTTLILVCIEGIRHDEAAQILGCPEGTVAWRVHEARRKLREHLALHGFAVPGEEP
ncbi:MAG: sigma-70 family RNA polymerase sigma factor [Deltaproteobacteria bacterium]|nr:sigma-70 family RNA polymerase sigma factor [Deltaproteobacteria bacterium]